MPKKIQRVEEQLDIQTREVETGRVRVKKRLEESVEAVELPERQEIVEVQRVPVHREVDSPVPTRQEGDVTVVSLHREITVVRTQLVVVEELHLRTRTVEDTRVEDVRLHHEVIDIERTSSGARPTGHA